jgi:hypothetical protein
MRPWRVVCVGGVFGHGGALRGVCESELFSDTALKK